MRTYIDVLARKEGEIGWPNFFLVFRTLAYFHDPNTATYPYAAFLVTMFRCRLGLVWTPFQPSHLVHVLLLCPYPPNPFD